MKLTPALLPLALLIVMFSACDSEPTADSIVNEVIAKSGGELYDKIDVEFDFRDIHYRAYRKEGMFSYERFIEDSLGQIHDVLTNDAFYRELNGDVVDVIDTMAVKYQRSVNSVWWFALLPKPLIDPAVNRKLLGESEIKGKMYYEIQVTFEQEGGGEDYTDVFVFWVNKETMNFDYMAYNYHVDGGGSRFREAINVQNVGGIQWVDWNNFKPKEEYEGSKIDEYETLWLEEKMELLSEIELRNIGVKPLD